MTLPTFDNFEALELDVEETRIFLRRGGSGPAVLLLHGFPQTHLMCRHSITSTTLQIAKPAGASVVPFLCCGASEDR